MTKAKKWIGITGSWRKTNSQVEKDVRSFVGKVIGEGAGIITGGALGVDYFATDEVLKLNPTAEFLRIFLPVTLGLYSAHYRKRADERVITHKQAEDLISQLEKIKEINPNTIHENKTNTEVNKDTYFERITEIVNHSDEIVAFQVNASGGTQDTIDKAKKKRIPVRIFTYSFTYPNTSGGLLG